MKWSTDWGLKQCLLFKTAMPPLAILKLFGLQSADKNIPGSMSSYSDITRGNLDLSDLCILELWEGIIGFYPEVH